MIVSNEFVLSGATSLRDLMGNSSSKDRCAAVQLQAGAGGVNYGGNAGQPMILAASAFSDVLPVEHLQDLWVSGTGPVRVIVFYD